MFLKFRITFTILAAIFAAAALPVGTWAGLTWAIACAVAAGICFVIMLIFKQEQEKREPLEAPDHQENTPENK